MPENVKSVKETITCFLDTGEFKSLKDDSDKMEISGWASTKDIDLEGHVVLPTAFNKHFKEYETKGRYWYNHDPNKVIGSVKEARLTDDGFYIDRAVLPATEFNKSFLFPLIKEGGLNEHSIQFWSLDSEYDKVKKVLYHKTVRLIETSIVSMACNPGAVIENFKAYIPSVDFENCSLDTLIELDKKGLVQYPSEIRKNFYMTDVFGSELESTNTNDSQEETMQNKEIKNFDPDFREFTPLKARIEKENHLANKESKEISFPKKFEKDYEEKVKSLFLAKSETKSSYLFKVGKLTESGPIYDFDEVASSLAMLTGVKGGYILADDVRLSLFEEVSYIYSVLEKTLPTYEGIALDKIDDETLLSLKWSDLVFTNDEATIIESKLLSTNLKSVHDLLKKYEKLEESPSFVNDAFKKYLGMSVNTYASISEYSDEKEIETITEIFSLINEFFSSKREEEKMESKDLDISTSDFVNFLQEKSATEAKETQAAEETEEAEEEIEDMTDLILEAFSTASEEN